MKAVLAVALGGALGSVGRYLIAGQAQAWFGPGFPLGTLLVNVLGSCIIGFLFFWCAERDLLAGLLPHWLFVGALGGFTTFSTFSLDALALALEGEIAQSLTYVAASVSLCLLGVWLGMMAARALA